MNKILFSLVLSGASAMAYAQGGYDAGNIVQSDLNGTARYVGMGGALNALGADMSTMNSNPAGIGLFRKSDISVTGSILVSAEAPQLTEGRTRSSLDNAGAVFCFPLDDSGRGLQFVNLGISYRKNRNFFGNNSVAIAGLNRGDFSQTYQLAALANDAFIYDYFEVGLPYMSAPFYDDKGNLVDDEGYPVHCSVIGDDLNNNKAPFFGTGAAEAKYYRTTYGGSSEVNFDLAFNNSDRFYYGISLGVHSLTYNRNSFYAELASHSHDDGSRHFYDFSNSYITSGTGFDVKFGVVWRPIEDSPFRFGFSACSPIWYKLTDANSSELYVDDEYISYFNSGDYDYKLRTPWKFNLSLGHTIGTKIALGAEYELCDYSSTKYSDTSGNPLAYYNDDKKEHNGDVKSVLTTQHTVKLGAEFKPLDNFAFRVGYNFVTSAYKNNKKNWRYYDSVLTDTDYTNWHGINRITLGAGYRWKGGYLDVAYQYQMQSGDFYAFSTSNYMDNELQASTIKNNRSQIMATLGFRF